MNAIGYFTAFAAIGGILALSTSYAERRNLKTWAPNAVVNTPKLVTTTAVPSPKLAAAAVGAAAVQEPVLMASSPDRTAIAQPPPMRDPDVTSALPKQAEAAAPQVPERSRTPFANACERRGPRQGCQRVQGSRPDRCRSSPLGSRSSSGSLKEEIEAVGANWLRRFAFVGVLALQPLPYRHRRPFAASGAGSTCWHSSLRRRPPRCRRAGRNIRGVSRDGGSPGGNATRSPVARV